MAANKRKNDTLCWQCKCSTNPSGTNCPWADKGKPVPNWEAVPGKMIRTQLEDGSYRKEQAYIVKSCPLFIKDREFSTIEDVVRAIAKTLNITEASAKIHLDKKIARWERATGRQMPEWVKQRRENKGENI